jgi:hypothetical protein
MGYIVHRGRNEGIHNSPNEIANQIYECSILFVLFFNMKLCKVSAIRAIFSSYEIRKNPDCGFSLGYKILLMRRCLSGSSLIISNIIDFYCYRLVSICFHYYHEIFIVLVYFHTKLVMHKKLHIKKKCDITITDIVLIMGQTNEMGSVTI